MRFVLQSGDAVLRGQNGAMWNVSFSPIIERLTRGANIPYFFSVGNHDVTGMPPGDPGRALGLHNTLTVMSRLIPPEGSPRRLSGYPTYAFGYGNAFFIAFDSNIASDPIQLAWVTDQLEHLDRARYRHVIAFFHHPPFSSGPHGGASRRADARHRSEGAGPSRAADGGDPDAVHAAVPQAHVAHDRGRARSSLRPLGRALRRQGRRPIGMDSLVTGGGGAPIYPYVGEPDLRGYIAANAAQGVRVDHLVKPGSTPEENPHHFVVVQVDGDRLSLEVVGTGPAPYTPYNGSAKIVLSDGVVGGASSALRVGADLGLPDAPRE